jgi:hypothetical protein
MAQAKVSHLFYSSIILGDSPRVAAGFVGDPRVLLPDLREIFL